MTKHWIDITLGVLALPPLVGTGLSLLPNKQWWSSMFDFLRLQIIAWGVLMVIALLWHPVATPVIHYILLVSLGLMIAWQSYKIFPYMPFAPIEAPGHPREAPLNPEKVLSIMISNVLMDCRNDQKLLAIVEAQDPDLLLLLEPDTWWQEQLAVIHDRYPHRVEVPLDNLYGMILISKYPLLNPQVKYLIKDDIPSIHAQVERGDQRLQLHCLHPEPPFPTEAWTSRPRDKELLLVAAQIQRHGMPAIAMGDLNDVAWSDTTTRFQQVSGLLDPRKGRGIFNSFHARYPWCRFPLDHIFYSPAFKLLELKRLPYFGSDHFPVYARLYLDQRQDATDNLAPDNNPETHQ